MQAPGPRCACRQAADHAAFERETLRALASSSPATGRGRLRVDTRSLRRALGGRGELVEAMEAKASGRPGVNVGRVWAFMMNAMYQSGDLPVLAVREMTQNSKDSIAAAVRARKLRAGTGRIAISWDPARRALSVEDNGIGMDAPTILGKFLSLGETGKEGADDSEVAAGGFGVAKAVILGASSTFRWELHTRDNLAVSEGRDQDVRIYEAPSYLAGARITVFDVSEKFDLTWDYARQEGVALADRLREMLAANDLRGVELVLDGEPVGPMFSRRAGSKVKLEGSWGRGTTATVKAYRRPPGDRRGAYYLRLGGPCRTPPQSAPIEYAILTPPSSSITRSSTLSSASLRSWSGRSFHAWSTASRNTSGSTWSSAGTSLRAGSAASISRAVSRCASSGAVIALASDSSISPLTTEEAARRIFRSSSPICSVSRSRSAAASSSSESASTSMVLSSSRRTLSGASTRRSMASMTSPSSLSVRTEIPGQAALLSCRVPQ